MGNVTKNVVATGNDDGGLGQVYLKEGVLIVEVEIPITEAGLETVSIQETYKVSEIGTATQRNGMKAFFKAAKLKALTDKGFS